MQRWAALFAKPGVKQAASNFGWLLFERAVRFVLNLVVGIFVVRYLGPERLGELSYCLAIVMLLSCVTALGVDAPVKRDIIRQPEGAGGLLAAAALARLAVAVVFYGLIVLFAAQGWGVSRDERPLLLVVGLLLFQPAAWVGDLWLEAQLQARAVVVARLLVLALTSGVRIVLIAQQGSVIAFAWVQVVEVGLGACGIMWATGRAGLRLHWRGIDRTLLSRLLAESWPLLFASLAVMTYMKIDEVMLRHFAGPQAVGAYAAAARLSEVWYFLPVAAASSLLPALVRAREAGAEAYGTRLQQYYDLSAATGYILSIPMALLAPWIVGLAYGQEFAEAGPILAVHIWSSIFVFLGVARSQWLVNEGLQKFLLVATVAGAVSNILLNLVMIPRWGGLGAAYATVISYAIAGWLASYAHPIARQTAGKQMRALLIPLRWWNYLRR